MFVESSAKEVSLPSIVNLFINTSTFLLHCFIVNLDMLEVAKAGGKSCWRLGGRCRQARRSCRPAAAEGWSQAGGGEVAMAVSASRDGIDCMVGS